MSQIANDPSARPEAERFAGLIKEQVEAEARQVIESATARAERTMRAAEDEAAALLAQAHEQGLEHGRRRAARLLAESEAKLQRDWLRAREALIDAVLSDAAAQMEGLAATADASAVLGALIQEAVASQPPGRVRVSVPADCLALVDQVELARFAGDRWQLDCTAEQVPGGGVIVTAADGRMRFDNSFAARRRRGQAALRRMIATCLFTR